MNVTRIFSRSNKSHLTDMQRLMVATLRCLENRGYRLKGEVDVWKQCVEKAGDQSQVMEHLLHQLEAAEDYSERSGLAAEKRVEAFIMTLACLINQHVDPPADTAPECDYRARLMERRRKLWGLDEEESQLI